MGVSQERIAQMNLSKYQDLKEYDKNGSDYMCKDIIPHQNQLVPLNLQDPAGYFLQLKHYRQC